MVLGASSVTGVVRQHLAELQPQLQISLLIGGYACAGCAYPGNAGKPFNASHALDCLVSIVPRLCGYRASQVFRASQTPKRIHG